MDRRALILLLTALVGCHGFFGGRTRKEEEEVAEFAQTRERAARYYDGGDFERAALQYEKALTLRPEHLATRLGFAYSLLYTDRPTNLLRADKEFRDMGKLRKNNDETKRIYGLGMTQRNLATHYQRRSLMRRDQGRQADALDDEAAARNYARDGIKYLQEILDMEDKYSSLKPDAHIGMAHCAIILGKEDDYSAAVYHIEEFAKIAANARRFWEQRHEKVLVVDPLADMMEVATAEDLQRRYNERILRTLQQEVAARQALMQTYLWNAELVGQDTKQSRVYFMKAIEQATTVLKIDPTEDEMLWMRGRAYARLGNYLAAKTDLEEYRSHQDMSRLTERQVAVQQLINEYEQKMKERARSSSGLRTPAQTPR
jgi:tetratricopeptide (TPR) repeat protein